VAIGIKRGRDIVTQVHLEAEQAYLEHMVPLVQQVMHQTRERVLKGNTHVAGKNRGALDYHPTAA
jgi:IS5 family transposase